jgi:hypothetical protein
MTRVTALKRVANGVGLVVVLAIAWFVTQTTPTEEEWQAPIVVSGDIGETLTGRNIEAVVSEVRIAESVTASNGWAGPTSGVWVVVDTSVSSVVDDFGVSLGTAELVIDGITYSASERPDDGTIARAPLTTAIPLTGPLMFEIPRDLVESEAATSATIQLAVNSDPRADSLLAITVDLSALPLLPSVETDEPIWGAL